MDLQEFRLEITAVQLPHNFLQKSPSEREAILTGEWGSCPNLSSIIQGKN